MCFVKGYRILMKSQLSGADIAYAELLLEAFYDGMERLYEKSYCPIKVHQAIHAASVVRNFGPLNNVSAYLFEDLNGQIVKRNHAKKMPTENLHNVVEEHFYLPTILTSLVDDSGSLIDIDHPFVTYLRRQLGWTLLIGTHISKFWRYMTATPLEYTYRKSKATLAELDPNLRRFISSKLHTSSINVIETFAIGRQKYQSRNSAKYSTNSSWIQYINNEKAYCGQIEIALEENTQYYVVVSSNNVVFKQHTHRGRLNEDRVLQLIPIKNIRDMCVYAESVNTYTLSPLHSFHYDIPTTDKRATVMLPAKIPNDREQILQMQQNMDLRIVNKKKKKN